MTGTERRVDQEPATPKDAEVKTFRDAFFQINHSATATVTVTPMQTKSVAV